MSTTGKKKTIKNTNIWMLNNMLLNNQQITEEIKICIETNESENTKTIQIQIKISHLVMSDSETP